MGSPLDAFTRALLPDMPLPEAMKIIYECVDEENRRLSRHGGELYGGVEETLAALSKKHPLFIVSNCEVGYLEAFFTAHGLKKYFTDWACNGGTGLSKADNIKRTVEKNALDSAVYVGDTALDKASADQAGIPFVFAEYGFGKVEGVKSIARFSDILNII